MKTLRQLENYRRLIVAESTLDGSPLSPLARELAEDLREAGYCCAVILNAERFAARLAARGWTKL